jgi:hypothetical protein
MPKIPGINHLEAIKALEKAGFRLVRQGKTYSDDQWHSLSHYSPEKSYQRLYHGRNRQGCGIEFERI